MGDDPKDPTPLHPEEASALLERARARILEVDDFLIRTIGERRDLVLGIARAKEVLGLPVLDPAREAAVVRRAAARARELGVDEEMTRDVIWRIVAAARAAQEGRLQGWPEAPSPPSPATESVPVSSPSTGDREAHPRGSSPRAATPPVGPESETISPEGSPLE